MPQSIIVTSTAAGGASRSNAKSASPASPSARCPTSRWTRPSPARCRNGSFFKTSGPSQSARRDALVADRVRSGRVTCCLGRQILPPQPRSRLLVIRRCYASNSRNFESYVQLGKSGRCARTLARLRNPTFRTRSCFTTIPPAYVGTLL